MDVHQAACVQEGAAATTGGYGRGACSVAGEQWQRAGEIAEHANEKETLFSQHFCFLSRQRSP